MTHRQYTILTFRLKMKRHSTVRGKKGTSAWHIRGVIVNNVTIATTKETQSHGGARQLQPGAQTYKLLAQSLFYIQRCTTVTYQESHDLLPALGGHFVERPPTNLFKGPYNWNYCWKLPRQSFIQMSWSHWTMWIGYIFSSTIPGAAIKRRFWLTSLTGTVEYKRLVSQEGMAKGAWLIHWTFAVKRHLSSIPVNGFRESAPPERLHWCVNLLKRLGGIQDIKENTAVSRCENSEWHVLCFF